MALFEPIFEALNNNDVRYVVVGGVATVLHGYPRLTADVDLIVDLDPVAALNAMRSLSAMGLRPRAPVSIEAFAESEIRQSWIRDKGMRVFSLWDPSTPLREVDIFVETPIPFADLWSRSEVVNLHSTWVRIASIPDLIYMKGLAGRPEDLQDIEALTAIQEQRTNK